MRLRYLKDGVEDIGNEDTAPRLELGQPLQHEADGCPVILTRLITGGIFAKFHVLGRAQMAVTRPLPQLGVGITGNPPDDDRDIGAQADGEPIPSLAGNIQRNTGSKETRQVLRRR